MKQHMSNKRPGILGIGCAGLLACALGSGCGSSMPTKELGNARQSYRLAKTSDAATLAPADLHRAQRALERAERAHQDDPGSFAEASLAYMAQREAEIAMANASQASALRNIEQANRMYASTQSRLLEQAQAEAAASTAALVHAQAELKDLQQQLQGFSKVRSDQRGLVITLDGAVLFESGKSELLPTAKDKLGRVAEVLQKQDPRKRILVQGHTDSVGSEQANLELSRQRAEAVKSFLIERGIPEERITGEGKGESQPLTSNDSPEGRANNRRVEIVVLP